MRVLGIDPSSSCTGVAVVEDSKLLESSAWIKPKIGSSSDRLYDCYCWLHNYILYKNPDMVVIEYLSVSRNAEATRKISHYQGVCALAARKRGKMIIEGRVTSARKAALGKGNLSKKECFEMIKKKFPDHKFGRWETPGGDETDAVVLALAAYQLAER